MRCTDTSDELMAVGWSSHLVASLSESEMSQQMLVIAAALGSVVAGGRSGRHIERLTPIRSEDAPVRSLSAQWGLGPQPWHTDLAHRPDPPRYVLLGCVDPGEASVSTELLDARQGLSEQELDDAAVEPFLIRSGRQPFYATILERGRAHFRFDPGCMGATTARGRALAEAISSSERGSVLESSWQVGHILIVDNWRMLHRRQAAPAGSSRTLLRVYVAGGES